MSAHLTLLELDALAEAGPNAAPPHLDECERCRSELALMQSAQQRFRSEVFPRTAPTIERKLAGRGWRGPWRWVAPLALAPALAVLSLTLRPHPRSHSAVEPAFGIKGAATVRLFAQHQGHVTEVRDGDTLEPGDALRFEIQPGGLAYLLVGSVDGAGEAGIIFPASQPESARIDPMAQFALPGSAVLDASPGPERAFVLLSARPISAEAAKAAMRRLAQGGPTALRAATVLPDVGADAQLSVLWEKRTP
jgi:hypothetical protein